MPNLNFLQSLEAWLSAGVGTGMGRRVMVAITVVVVAFLLARLLRAAFDRFRDHSGPAVRFGYIVERIGGYVIIVLGALTAVSALGIDLESLTVFAGAVGVGLGLGLQGVVKEFVSGLVLVLDPSIQIGDVIELEGGVRGEVVEIGPRAARLRTNDGVNVVVPNSNLMQSQVLNWTYNSETRRIHVPFSVAEESDKALVRDVVLAAAHALPFTQPDHGSHKTQVWLTKFDANGLDFELVVWPTLESARHARSMHAAYTWAIHEALSAASIENSTPQMDLRVRSIFGREGEHALRALKLGSDGEDPPAPPVRTAPNDAATAVIDDVDRQRREREEDQPRRREAPP